MDAALVLPARLDLPAARRLTRDLRDRSGQPLRLDGGGVSHLGALCLQVLLAAAQDWRRRHVALTVTGASDAFITALSQFGLTTAALESGART